MADANPWRTLPETVQRDLAGPLFDKKTFTWDQEKFKIWFSKFYSGKPVKPEAVYSEWRFNCGLGLETTNQRNMLLCLYAKLSNEDLWNQIGSIDWFSLHAEMTFFPARGEEALKKVLLDKGYTNALMAKRDEDTWGLRSPKSGAELHFRGPLLKDQTNEYCNVHLDLNNPGTSKTLGPFHFLNDDKLRSSTHNLQTVQAALKRQRIDFRTVP
jgi:hypothetical protein